MSFEHIRATYHVPARKGARVAFDGHLGTVTRCGAATVRVQFDGSTHSQPFAPRDLQWLEDSPLASAEAAEIDSSH